MKKITATELARNLRAVIDRVNETGEEYIIERGRRPVARVSPTPGQLDAGTADVFGEIAAWFRERKASHSTRVQDLWLASQAIQHSIALVTRNTDTRNTDDFAGIPGLDLVWIEAPPGSR